jgi:prephenate dehydratase
MGSIVAIQGDQASFHDIAASQFFGGQSGRVFCDTFTDTIQAIVDKRADYALCAIENSLYGSINEVYDLILANKLYIFGEVYLRIEQCLIGLPEAQLSDISEIYSHPVALAQCEEYLDNTLPQAERLEYHDTAAAVEKISQLLNPQFAAIASRQAAKLYGMQILAESIETNKANYTRFIALSTSQPDTPVQPNKTSIVLRTTHTPGALYNALGCFAKRGINLSKIQSRPIIGKAWHYMFYADVSAGAQDENYQQAIQELQAQDCKVIVLGSYLSDTSAN